jgi:hypothetical protein
MRQQLAKEEHLHPHALKRCETRKLFKQDEILAILLPRALADTCGFPRMAFTPPLALALVTAFAVNCTSMLLLKPQPLISPSFHLWLASVVASGVLSTLASALWQAQ